MLKFTGNPLDYHYFMSLFKEAVEYKIDEPHWRLVQLLKYTEGEARETIKHCIQQPVDIRYDRAKLLLEQPYGDPRRILAAYRKEIKGWPSLKPGNSSSHWKFHNFLIKCESTMSQQQWNSLNSPDILYTPISKLPGNLRDKWNRKVGRLYSFHQWWDFVSQWPTFFSRRMESVCRERKRVIWRRLSNRMLQTLQTRS